MEISQALSEKRDRIIQQWIEEVRHDDAIQSDQQLTYDAIQDGIAYVIDAIAILLAQEEGESSAEEKNQLIQNSLEHGTIRAQQGYDAEEIAREYRLLRQVIFASIEDNLLQASSRQALYAVRLIDSTLDDVIGRCFKSYTDGKISEFSYVREQLLLTNQELERLVKAQRDNISRLAHELKNPLTSIIGYSDLFLRQQKQKIQGQAPSMRSIEQVLRSGRHILRLINDALEIARYEDGQMRLRPAEVDVCDLVDHVTEIFQVLADEKDITIVPHCALIAPVTTDMLRLQQILTNLISNAIRYTETGSVTVKVYPQGDDQFAIAVSDTGIGIAASDQERIFEPFYRADWSGHRPDSTGLGLAIVAKLVQLLQGEIHLDSEPNRGTTFTVTLPMTIDATVDLSVSDA